MGGLGRVCVMWPRGGALGRTDVVRRAGADVRCGCAALLGAPRDDLARRRGSSGHPHTRTPLQERRGGAQSKARRGSFGFCTGGQGRRWSGCTARGRAPKARTLPLWHDAAPFPWSCGGELRDWGARAQRERRQARARSAHLWCPFVCQRLPGHALRARPLSARLEHLQCPRTAHRASRALVSAGACHS